MYKSIAFVHSDDYKYKSVTHVCSPVLKLAFRMSSQQLMSVLLQCTTSASSMENTTISVDQQAFLLVQLTDFSFISTICHDDHC